MNSNKKRNIANKINESKNDLKQLKLKYNNILNVNDIENNEYISDSPKKNSKKNLKDQIINDNNSNNQQDKAFKENILIVDSFNISNKNDNELCNNFDEKQTKIMKNKYEESNNCQDVFYKNHNNDNNVNHPSNISSTLKIGIRQKLKTIVGNQSHNNSNIKSENTSFYNNQTNRSHTVMVNNHKDNTGKN